MDTIEQAGTAMAFPSQTLYLERVVSITAKAAEAGVPARTSSTPGSDIG
jgi:hypothetical protein